MRDGRLPLFPAQDQRMEGRDELWRKSHQHWICGPEHEEGATPQACTSQSHLCLLWQEVSPNQWKNLKDKSQGSTAPFSFRHLSAYQLLLRLCCRIKLLSWPERILQEQKAAELKGRSKEYTTQKPKGKESAKKCQEANWNIKQPTLVTGNISSNPGIMQAEPGPKYPRDLVLAGPQCSGRWDPGYINTKEHLYNCCMAQARSHWHPIAPGVWQVPALAPSPSRTSSHPCTSPWMQPRWGTRQVVLPLAGTTGSLLLWNTGQFCIHFQLPYAQNRVVKFQIKHFHSALRWQHLEKCRKLLPAIPLLDK